MPSLLSKWTIASVLLLALFLYALHDPHWTGPFVILLVTFVVAAAVSRSSNVGNWATTRKISKASGAIPPGAWRGNPNSHGIIPTEEFAPSALSP